MYPLSVLDLGRMEQPESKLPFVAGLVAASVVVVDTRGFVPLILFVLLEK